MIKTTLLFTLIILVAGCGAKSGPVSGNSNSAEPLRSEKMQALASRTGSAQPQTNVAPPSAENSPPESDNAKWARGGEPVDTEKFDAAIKKAEKALKANPDEPTAKKAVAQAYFERGFALTMARQYAAALGDYRRVLKVDPNDEEAKKWIDQISNIYKMLKKAPPVEGQEPAPLPFEKS